MRRLLAFADVVDRLTESLGQWLKWLVLFSSLISAFNALMRYTIHYSSNAWLEIQWYMFGALVMLGTSAAILPMLAMHWRLSRPQGFVLLVSYLAYIGFLAWRIGLWPAGLLGPS